MLRPLVNNKTQVRSQCRRQHASADWVAAEMHELASRLTRYVNWAKVNILVWIAAPSIMQAWSYSGTYMPMITQVCTEAIKLILAYALLF